MNNQELIALVERTVESIEMDFSRRLFRSKFLVEKIEKDLQAQMDVVASDLGYTSDREVSYSKISDNKGLADLIVDGTVLELKYHTNVKCRQQLDIVNKDVIKMVNAGLSGYVIFFQGTDTNARHKKYGKLISFEEFTNHVGDFGEEYMGTIVHIGERTAHDVQIQYTIIKVKGR